MVYDMKWYDIIIYNGILYGVRMGYNKWFTGIDSCAVGNHVINMGYNLARIEFKWGPLLW